MVPRCHIKFNYINKIKIKYTLAAINSPYKIFKTSISIGNYYENIKQ